MKKFVLLLISLLIVVNCAMAVPKVIDLDKENNPKAAEILFKFIVKENEWLQNDPKMIKKVRLSEQATQAQFVDLNDDGINEIIGFTYSALYYGLVGESLFIIQKTKDGYKDIDYIINFQPHKIVVLDSKTNGWRDIQITANAMDGFTIIGNKKYKLKYNGEVYLNSSFIKQLENVMENANN